MRLNFRKPHIMSFEINGLKPYNLPREVSTYNERDAQIYHYFWLFLYSFLPNKIKNLTCCMSETSITGAHKGVGGGQGVTLQNG